MNKKEIKQIFNIGIPSLISWIGHIGYGVSDNFMIGKILGSEALAVSGIATSLYFIFLCFGMGSSSIIVALISEASVKNKHKLSKIMQNSLIFCITLGVFISLILVCFSHVLIPLVNNQAELNSQAILFIHILSPAPIFVMIFIAFERLSEGLSKSKYSMYTVIICNFINAFLNYSFLSGSFGLPALGIKGAAIGTILVNILEATIIILLCYNDKITKLGLQFKTKYFSIQKIKYIASLGLPGGFFSLSEMAVFSIGGFLASSISIYDIAAHQILSWGIGIILTPIFGFAVAITVRVAYNNADNKPQLAFKIGYYSMICSAIYTAIALLIVWIFRNEVSVMLLRGGKDDMITAGLIASTLSVILIGQIFDGVQIMGSAVLRGYKDTKIPLIFALISYWGMCIPFGYYFCVVKKMGVFGVWIGIAIGIIFHVFCIALRLLKYRKKVLV